MKKFTFSLESLLSAKLLQEKEAKKNLVQSEEVLRREQNQLVILKGSLEDAFSQWQQRVKRGSHAHHLMLDVHHISVLQEQIILQTDVIEQAKQANNHCQQQLGEIFAEVKAMKILREQHYEAFLAEEAREKDKVIDEFVSFQIHRTAQLGSHA